MEGTFSYWMRTNLKDAYSGLITQDVDFVIIINKKIYFIEEKNRSNARIGPAQKVIYKMICDLFKNSKNLDYEFEGVAIINIENEQTSLNEVKKLINESIRKEIEIENDILNKLWDCRGLPFIRKTEVERSGYRTSILEKIFWNNKIYTRTKDNIYVERIHWLFLNYCTGYFIFLEEQTCGNFNISDDRRRFIKLIDDMFSRLSKENERSLYARNPKSGAVYKYIGYYELAFSGTNPDNSNKIYLNGKEITREKLVSLLNLDSVDIVEYRGK
ncbi:MAG: hypothetical protein RMI01_08680 [Thermodesulfovibrio sp.]|nr:hypothetical protein [Thermodesulfovibrio sp.]